MKWLSSRNHCAAICFTRTIHVNVITMFLTHSLHIRGNVEEMLFLNNKSKECWTTFRGCEFIVFPADFVCSASRHLGIVETVEFIKPLRRVAFLFGSLARSGSELDHSKVFILILRSFRPNFSYPEQCYPIRRCFNSANHLLMHQWLTLISCFD